MPVTPSQFIRQQLDAQQLTIKQFAARSGLGLSHAYQLLRGERTDITVETMDAIARGFGMTPAEMAAAMGKSEANVDPGQLAWNAMYGQMDAATRSKVVPMVRAAANTSDDPTANTPAARLNRRRRGPHTGTTISSAPGRIAAYAGSLVAFVVRPFRLGWAPTAATA